MVTFKESDIIQYTDFFSKEDYAKILDRVYDSGWRFGHTSYPPEDPRFNTGYPFWVMGFENDSFFTNHLLNIIEEKTNQKYELFDVYANGHTFGTKGSLHQDWRDDRGRTFLFYANEMWNVDWGGKTIFDLGNGNYYFHVPKPNSSVLFPGIISHAAEGPTRNFPGLRVTIAWKLLLK